MFLWPTLLVVLLLAIFPLIASLGLALSNFQLAQGGFSIKFAGLTDSGGEAKQLISEGLVLLNDVVETQKRKKLAVGDRVKANGHVIIVKLA